MKNVFKRMITCFCMAALSVTAVMPSVLAADEAVARSGSCVLKVELGKTPKWGGPFQIFAVEQNKEYVCKAWAKGKGKIALQMKGGDWKLIQSASITDSADWKEYSFTFNSGENSKLVLQFIDSNVEGTLYIDDLFVGTADGSTNLLSNGSFEALTASWKMDSTFSVEKGVPSKIEYDTRIVDQYGQLKSKSFPEKITSDQQLKDIAAWEKEYFGKLTPPGGRDEYRGLQGSKEKLGLAATGFFHVQKLSDGKWVMVDPLGNLFFSVGVGGVAYADETYTVTKGREEIFDWLPKSDDSQYKTAFLNENFSFYISNWTKKYGKPFDMEAYTGQQLERVNKWGFTSTGPISDRLMNKEIPIVTSLTMPKKTLIGSLRVYDVFKPNWAEEAEEAIKEKLIANKDNNMIIGYFLENEPLYDYMEKQVPGKKASEVSLKKKVVDMVKEKYKGDVKTFNTAWGMKYSSFDDIYETMDLVVNTDKAHSDFAEFKKLYFDTYYKTIRDIVRKYDTKHMLLGDRIMTTTSNDKELMDIVYGAMGKYMDVVSYNNYRESIDLEKVKSLYNAAGKPLMLTEFSYGDISRGMRPFSIVVPDPETKGKCYRNYVEQHAASGMVVGTQWFIYLDQAVTGRYFEGLNGESYGLGMIDVADRPYLPVVNAMKETNENIYKVILGETKPYTFDPYKKESVKSNTAEQQAKDRLKDAVVLMLGSPDALVNNAVKKIDSNPQVQPVVKDGRTLVPVRFIVENLSAKVSWEEATKTVTVNMDGKEIKFVIDSSAYTVDGEAKTLEVPAQTINDRTMIPLRAMVEAVGRKVFWDNKGLIVISKEDKLLDSAVDGELIEYIINSNFKQ